MADNAEHPQPSRSSTGMRKLAFVVGTLFVVWIVFGQVVPRAMFPALPASKTATISAPKSEDALKEKDERIAAMQGQIDNLEAKIKALEDVIAVSPKADTTAKEAAPVTTPADDERAQHLEALLDQQGKDLQAMKSQMTDIETRNTRQLTAVNAFGLMKDAIRRGTPFAIYHTQLTQALEGNADAEAPLKILAPYAAQGAITLSELQSSFEVFIPSALAQSGDKGLLNSLVSIRKVGEQPGNDDEAVIARAETRLDAADVETCLKELAGLSPQAASVFAPWVAHAQAFVTTGQAVDTLELAIAGAKPAPALLVAPAPVSAPVPVPAPAVVPPPVQTPPVATPAPVAAPQVTAPTPAPAPVALPAPSPAATP